NRHWPEDGLESSSESAETENVRRPVLHGRNQMLRHVQDQKRAHAVVGESFPHFGKEKYEQAGGMTKDRPAIGDGLRRGDWNRSSKSFCGGIAHEMRSLKHCLAAAAQNPGGTRADNESSHISQEYTRDPDLFLALDVAQDRRITCVIAASNVHRPATDCFCGEPSSASLQICRPW